MRACAGNSKAKGWCSISPTWRHSARNSGRPGFIPNGRANTETRRGRCWRSPPASCRNASPKGLVMAHAEISQAVDRGLMPPRRRSLAASLDQALGTLVEIPAAALVVAEVVILFAGVVARYGLHQPLIWSD